MIMYLKAYDYNLFLNSGNPRSQGFQSEKLQQMCKGTTETAIQ